MLARTPPEPQRPFHPFLAWYFLTVAAALLAAIVIFGAIQLAS
jgi:hypothetical protein